MILALLPLASFLFHFILISLPLTSIHLHPSLPSALLFISCLVPPVAQSSLSHLPPQVLPFIYTPTSLTALLLPYQYLPSVSPPSSAFPPALPQSKRVPPKFIQVILSKRDRGEHIIILYISARVLCNCGESNYKSHNHYQAIDSTVLMEVQEGVCSVCWGKTSVRRTWPSECSKGR